MLPVCYHQSNQAIITEYTGWGLNPQTSVFPQFQSLLHWDWGPVGHPLCTADCCLLAGSSHGLSLVHMQGRRALVSLPLLKKTSALSDCGAILWPHLTLIISQQALSHPNTATLGVRTSVEIGGQECNPVHIGYPLP